jgi:hypothetical protein
MFIIVVEGGQFDGTKIDEYGELHSGVTGVKFLEFNNLKDAQDWVEKNCDRDDFGYGEPKLTIEEVV